MVRSRYNSNLAGLGQAQTPASYVERAHIYVFEYDNLAAAGSTGDTVTGLFQLIDNDSDFYWRGIAASSTTNLAFGVRFQDPNGYYLSDVFVPSFVYASQYLASPFAFVPAFLCPAGSKIVIDLQNQANSTNSVLINLIGVKRFYV